MTFWKTARRLSHGSLGADKRGATAIEYALIASLISVGIIGGLSAFTDATNERYDTIAAEVSAVMD
jgi:pilus assembly protein Flp/PilA